MGENKHIEELDAFAKKYIKELPIETPSVDFTKNIMGKIATLQTTKALEYKPLISKKGWFLVAASIVAVLFFAFKNTKERLFTLPEINFSFFEKLDFSGLLNGINISTSTVYVLLFFSLLFFVQIFYLKGYFEKRINS
ncbi:MAG: hypothetical protein HWD85_00315 [Flavobacteriaceae bacterium]|nr:hypothetical protein [Flavobacteriaceae bacterium]